MHNIEPVLASACVVIVDKEDFGVVYLPSVYLEVRQMARNRNNPEIEGTREFYALSGRNKRNSISETRTFDAPKEKRKVVQKKHTQLNKGVSMMTINFSIIIILLALIVCLVVLVAIYHRVNG